MYKSLWVPGMSIYYQICRFLLLCSVFFLTVSLLLFLAARRQLRYILFISINIFHFSSCCSWKLMYSGIIFIGRIWQIMQEKCKANSRNCIRDWGAPLELLVVQVLPFVLVLKVILRMRLIKCVLECVICGIESILNQRKRKKKLSAKLHFRINLGHVFMTHIIDMASFVLKLLFKSLTQVSWIGDELILWTLDRLWSTV